jgi:hypothetical protein
VRFTTGTSATDPGTRYDTEPVPVGDTIRGIMADLSATHGCIHTGRWQCCADVAPCPCRCPGCAPVRGELSRDYYPPARRRTP